MTNQAQNTPMAALLTSLLTDAAMREEEFGARMGLTDVEVASLLDGTSVVKISMLPKLAQIFDMGVRDFFESHEALPNSHRRIVSSAGGRVNKQTVLRLRLSRWVNDYRFLEDKLSDKLPFAFSALRETYVGTGKPENGEVYYPEEFSVEGRLADARLVQCLEPVANEARKLLDLDSKDPVPFDICRRLEDAGVKVLLSPYKDFEIRGFAIAEEDNGPALFVNSATLPKRSRYVFTLIHELGHLILTPTSGGLEVRKEEDPKKVPYDEAIANWFASLFVMPIDLFKEFWKRRPNQSSGTDEELMGNILHMEKKLNVNKKVIARRLIHEGFIEIRQRESALAKFEIQDGSVSDAENMLQKSDYPVRLKELAGRAFGEKIITRSRAKEILSLVPWQDEDLFKPTWRVS